MSRSAFCPVVRVALAMLTLVAAAIAAPARSQTIAPETTPTNRDVTISGDLEVGLSDRLARSTSSLIVGQPLTDRSERLLLNQAVITIDRSIEPAAPRFEVGGRLKLLFGSDGRYTRLSGQFGAATAGLGAFDVVEANLQFHLPLSRSSTVDLKLGSFLSPLGYEALSPLDTPFYSHGYIYAFGVPAKQAGLLAIVHLGRRIDLYLGVDAGANSSIENDNNRSAAITAGVGFNGRKITFVALTHVGPELPSGTPGVRPDRDLRYINDVVLTWQATPRLTATTELDYVRDDGLRAEAGGVAEYLAYSLSDRVTLKLRAEIWRDDKGKFVAAFPSVNDAFDLQVGRANGAVAAPAATYAALTLGLTYRPSLPGPLPLVLLRPEIRYDDALAGRPFDGGQRRRQATFAIDLVLPFSIPHGR